jgi:hypothetical protein
MPRYAQSNAGQIDASGIAGLGGFGQNALGMMLEQQQQDARMNLARRAQAADEAQAWAQNELRRKEAEQQQQQFDAQKAADRQGKIMQLAQLATDGESFEKIAQFLLPDMSPVERDFGRTFADETSRVKKEKEKAEKEEKEQSMLRGFVPGAVGGLANLPPDVQERAIQGMGQQTGLPPEILGLTVLSEKARLAEAKRKEEAANARAALRAGATADNAAATREATQANRDITHTTQLRKEFNGLSKDFLKQKDGYTRVLSSAKNPTAAGDLALIFNYMKVLDPNSVVRESEFATAAAAGAYGERIKGYVSKFTKGTPLSSAQRQDFVDRSNKLFHSAARNQRKLERRYRQLGKKAGLDPTQTATDFIGKLYKTSGVDVPAPPTSEPGASFVEMKNGVPVFQRPDGSFFMDTGNPQ